ncbi:8590_t:CDS:2, partial [Racocetra fulgida]
MGKKKNSSSSSEEKSDLCKIQNISQDSITATIRERYQHDFIYTRLNCSALVAVNPYKPLPIFNDSTVQEYAADYKDTSGQSTSLPPHAFQIASHAYLHMRRTVKQLTALSAHQKKASRIQTQVPCSEFILDSFGNAKTCSNINASRFGKYTELQFNERGKLIGAKTLDYLLEKNRVSNVPSNERNFHVFYYLIAGASQEEKAHLHLTEIFNYRYLNVAKGSKSSVEDVDNFNELKQALKSLGFHKKHVAQMFQLLASILHLGNIQFVQDSNKQKEAASVKNLDVLNLVADFLGLDPRSLENVLTYKTKLIKKEICTVFLDADAASIQRDDFAKALYSLLFSWIVEYINTKLCQDDFVSFIGILDLIGFQNLQSNSLDQFCVNFANEKIFNFTLNQLFEARKEEFQSEGINFSDIPYPDNKECLRMIAKPSTGLISIMNDQANKSNRKTDQTMLDAFNKKYSEHGSFIPTGKSLNSLPTFGIRHFAGQVTYDSSGFLEKNIDNLGADFVSLFRSSEGSISSSNQFIAGLFTDKAVATESHPRNDDTIVAAQQSVKPMRAPSMRRKKDQSVSDSSKPKVACVATQISSALDELCETFEETTPWYIFCIRPNDAQLPNNFNQNVVQNQVKSLGLPEIAKRLQTEYTNGMMHLDFLERYLNALDSIGLDQYKDPKAKCDAVANGFGWNIEDMATYLSEKAWRHLEDMLRRLDNEEKRKKKSDKKGISSMHDNGQDDAMSQDSYPSNQELYAGPRRLSPPRNFDQQSFYSGDDNRSNYSDDYNESYSQYGESVSHGSEIYAPSHNMFGGINAGRTIPEKEPILEEEPEEPRKTSAARKKWVFLTWLITWWIPPCFLKWCGGMKRKDIQMAWREKVALCMLIFLISCAVIFVIAVLGLLICPRVYIYTDEEVSEHSVDKSPDNVYVSIRGEVYSLSSFAPRHIPTLVDQKSILSYGGTDATKLFPVQVSALCSGVDPRVTFDYNLGNNADPNAKYHDFRYFTDDYRPDWYYEEILLKMKAQYLVGQKGVPPQSVKDMATVAKKQVAILYDNVYDLTSYVMSGRGALGPGGENVTDNVNKDFMNSMIVGLFTTSSGLDISKKFDALPLSKAEKSDQLTCLRNLFYIGKVDHRNSPQCLFSNYVLVAFSGALVAVILFKFLAALQLGARREPEEHDKFVICQVPCYTEGEESMRKTLDSLAVLRYDDKRKLLFIICDGMIVGAGNDRPTPRIVLDILGVDPNMDPEPLSFLSLGDGAKQHNMGKVYSGLYECNGHVVPYLVVVKVGKPSERSRPGNRGKRDSQMVLMKFLNKVHFNSEMTPLELEMYHQIKNVIGVNPSFYEYILMVDADTEVMPDSLNRLVSAFMHDTKVMGLCGETTLSNEKDSWVTMIQVYEYYISHHLSKAFESLFDYSENRVDTLHLKNLLHLGEDRYLTTLMMKHFSHYKMTFVPDAQCKTTAPDQWSVLISQRKKTVVSDEGKFDPKTIPKKKWSDYEQKLWEVNTQGSHDSSHTRVSDRSYRSNKKLGSAPGSQAGSVYGDYDERGGMKSRSRSPAPPYIDDFRSASPYNGGDVRSRSRHGDSASHRGSTLLRTDNDLSGSRPSSLIEAGYYGSSIIDSGFPSDDEILQEIRNILSVANLMTVTKKQ